MNGLGRTEEDTDSMPKDRRWGRWSRRPRDPFADPEPDPDAPGPAAPPTTRAPKHSPTHSPSPVADAPFPRPDDPFAPTGGTFPKVPAAEDPFAPAGGTFPTVPAPDDPFAPGDGAFPTTPFDAVPDPGPADLGAGPGSPAVPSPSPFDAPRIAGSGSGPGFADLGPLGGDPSVPSAPSPAPGPLDVPPAHLAGQAGPSQAPGNGAPGASPDDPAADRSELAQARYERMVAAAGLDPSHDLSPHGLSVLDWLARQDDAICSGVVEVLQATGQATIRHLRATDA
jgi:hypothetical protein